MATLIMLKRRRPKKPALVSGCMFYFPLSTICAKHRRECTAHEFAHECPADLRSSTQYIFFAVFPVSRQRADTEGQSRQCEATTRLSQGSR